MPLAPTQIQTRGRIVFINYPEWPWHSWRDYRNEDEAYEAMRYLQMMIRGGLEVRASRHGAEHYLREFGDRPEVTET